MMDRETFPTFEEAETDFQRELASFLNQHAEENESNTPDFILARYLLMALHAFNEGTNMREAWYGRRANLGDAVPDDTAAQLSG